MFLTCLHLASPVHTCSVSPHAVLGPSWAAGATSTSPLFTPFLSANQRLQSGRPAPFVFQGNVNGGILARPCTVNFSTLSPCITFVVLLLATDASPRLALPQREGIAYLVLGSRTQLVFGYSSLYSQGYSRCIKSLIPHSIFFPDINVSPRLVLLPVWRVP